MSFLCFDYIKITFLNIDEAFTFLSRAAGCGTRRSFEQNITTFTTYY